MRTSLGPPDIDIQIAVDFIKKEYAEVDKSMCICIELHDAIKKEDIKAVKEILDTGKIDINTICYKESPTGRTAIMQAVHTQNVEIVKELLLNTNSGVVDLSITNGWGMTALDMASRLKYGAIVNAILFPLREQAKINSKKECNTTPGTIIGNSPSEYFSQCPSGAQKDIKGKPRVDLVPLEVLECIAQPLEYGILKGYERDNWKKGILFRTSYAAALRHLSKFMSGADLDTEAMEVHKFTMNHINCALFHIASIALMVKAGRSDLDDR